MEVVQGKSTDKKIVIAQEIAFAKVLAGNNKTLRDRAVKKLKKWLTIRGNGKWNFTEEEFMRIWTGLFYCMWMSDKFLIQEELAESISSLVHCFKKNSDCALLFIKCFNKRIIMDWEGLDQYRIDKFNMLVRRFLRQTFVYCKRKDWEESFLYRLMGIFYNIVLHRDNSLGFVMHFINIYPEELAKVSKGKLNSKKVLILIEPFAKLVARSKDFRIQREAEGLFMYLMKQTDTGIEYEEKFNAWKEQGFPGKGPHCMKTLSIQNGNENEDESGNETDEENSFGEDEPLDPRAGSVHVFLPQIPIDADGIIDLLKKHLNSKFASPKGRRILKCLIQKYESLNRGKFPMRIKKDPILEEKKKKKMTARNASKLLKFTKDIDKMPIKTREYNKMSKELEDEDENSDVELKGECGDDDSVEEETNESNQIKKESLKMSKDEKATIKKLNVNNKKRQKNKKEKKKSKQLEISSSEILGVKENENHKENCSEDKKNISRKRKRKLLEQTSSDEEKTVERKKKKRVKVLSEVQQKPQTDPNITNKTGKKSKKFNSWLVEELNSSSPDYYKIETQKIIRLEKKLNEGCEENEPEHEEEEPAKEKKVDNEKSPEKEEIFPAFWGKALEKVNKKSGKKSKVFVNPFANANESKTLGRRISFALDKNMAQENEQYLEEVKNSPKVPFDGSKKPVQSALKSGLAPSPVNPFYRFKKIKF